MDCSIDATVPVKSRKPLLFPFLLTLLASVLLVTAFFLPFASASPEHKEWLQSYPNTSYAEEIGMTNLDAVHLSLFEFARIYAFAVPELSDGTLQAVGILCAIMISTVALFTLLALLFSLLRKATPTAVFACLTGASFFLVRWDFAERGVLPTGSYGYGIATPLYLVGCVLLLGGAVWLFAIKHQIKKTEKEKHI